MSNRRLIIILRFVVGVWRKYIELSRLAIVAIFILLLLTHQLLTVSGLILALGIVLYVVLTIMDKWLEKAENK